MIWGGYIKYPSLDGNTSPYRSSHWHWINCTKTFRHSKPLNSYLTSNQPSPYIYDSPANGVCSSMLTIALFRSASVISENVSDKLNYFMMLYNVLSLMPMRAIVRAIDFQFTVYLFFGNDIFTVGLPPVS